MSTLLWVLIDGGTARLVALDTGELSVGRSAGNGIVLAGDEQVSLRHAVLVRVAGGWCVRDLSSHNGTAVNGVRVTGDRPLCSGDEIRVGRCRLVFRDDAPSVDPATAPAEPVPELTRRERDVLLCLVRPLATAGIFTTPAPTKQIAGELYVTEAAVKLHLASLYRKFGIGRDRADSRRLALANEAIRRGAIRLAELRSGATGG